MRYMNLQSFKNPKVIAILVFIAIALWWMFSQNPRVSELNQLLKQDRELINYPYFFEVVDVKGTTATMLTPRSAKASALRSLRFMFPHLVYENDDSEAMLNAQVELARIQYKAANIIKAEHDIESIEWELDTWWLQGHGVSYFD